MYCYKCGQEIPDDAAFCPHCGANVKRENKDINVHPKTDYRALREIAKVLMILSDIALGFLIIPLFWCIPMTVHYFRAVREKRRVSEAFKVCTILFVSI
nr:zinc-ribbon domain-containing protein [Gammaproteobacteria bacterium]